MRLQLNQIALAGLLICHGASAFATSYFFVVPKSDEMSKSSSISVSLATTPLPSATVGAVYNTSGFDFGPQLTVSGDSSYNSSLATFALTSGNMPAGMALSTTGNLTGTPTAASAGTTLQVVATYKTITGSQSYSWVAIATSPASCAEILAATPSSASGWYTFDIDGAGPAVSQAYYCDMASDGGGWTRIVRQTEVAPVTNWNGGINGASYALATVQIPAHTHVGFGKDEQATFIDYVPFSYKTGDINPLVRVKSPKTGFSYDIHRSVATYYSRHNPEGVSSTNIIGGDWRNTLTFDKTGGDGYTWAFSANNVNQFYRGYSMAGSLFLESSQAYAWTVWVR